MMPTAWDREMAARLSPCSRSDRYEFGTCHATQPPLTRKCVACDRADAIATALATARAEGEATGRAEEREAHAEVVSALDELATIIDESVADRDFLDLDSFTTQPARRALAAIRAREGA